MGSEQQERKLSWFVVSCRVCQVLPCQQLVYHRMDLTQHVSCRHILCSSFSTTHFRSSLSLDDFDQNNIFSDFVVASVYHCPRIKEKFPNYALCVHLPIKFYEERKPAVTTTEGRDRPVKRSTYHWKHVEL